MQHHWHQTLQAAVFLNNLVVKVWSEVISEQNLVLFILSLDYIWHRALRNVKPNQPLSVRISGVNNNTSSAVMTLDKDECVCEKKDVKL